MVVHITLIFGILFTSLELKNTARLENFIIRIDIYSLFFLQLVNGKTD